MKKTLLIFVLTISLLQIGCSTSSSSNPTTAAVQGEWKLVAVDGTFAGLHETFAPGLITWTFNPIDQTVTVVNNNTDANAWDLLDTGVYAYHFVNNPDSPCGEQIEINGSIYGCYTVTSTHLIIDQAIADGFAITLQH
jgi:hypothetical protein